MLKRVLTVLTVCLLPTAALAGPTGSPSTAKNIYAPVNAGMVAYVSGQKTYMRVHRSGARKKSDRQKCLDMMLPQDGVDCMKKLKAKKSNN